jgi:hypothetical protein
VQIMPRLTLEDIQKQVAILEPTKPVRVLREGDHCRLIGFGSTVAFDLTRADLEMSAQDFGLKILRPALDKLHPTSAAK